MPNSTYGFSSAFDPDGLLRMMYGDGPFMPSSTSSGSNHGRTQYAPDPSLLAFDTPGIPKSPADLEALAAADPRPPGFYRSPALLGVSAMVPGFDSNPTPAVGQQAVLFGRPDLSSLRLPSLPPSWLAVTPVSFPPPASPPTTGGSIPFNQPLPVRPVNSPPTDIPNVTPAPATGPGPSSTVGRSGTAPPVEPPSNSFELEQEFQRWPGQIVRLPNGLPVLDPRSPTGYLMSPFSDLSDVAVAGRRLRPELEHLIGISPPAAAEYAYFTLRPYLGHGGTFDYQRRAYLFGKDGLTQLRQFRNVSNFNVGLLGQQANLGLGPLLWAAALYAAATGSPVFRVDQPYLLDPQTREFIEQGYRIGESGAYDSGQRP